MWGGVGVSLTTAENKLFLYRVLCFDVCFNLKKVIIQYSQCNPNPNPIHIYQSIYTSCMWGWGGVSLTTAKNKLFVYRVL